MNNHELPSTGLDLAAIHPDRGAKYSPSLYAWLTLRRAGHLTPRARLSGVYVDSRGNAWIGYPVDEAGFVGQRMSEVIAHGADAGIGAWRQLGTLRPLLGFWRRYVDVGRCAWDEAHARPDVYTEHRWARTGDTRRCRWCAAGNQVLSRWTEAQDCEAWEPLPSDRDRPTPAAAPR